MLNDNFREYVNKRMQELMKQQDMAVIKKLTDGNLIGLYQLVICELSERGIHMTEVNNGI